MPFETPTTVRQVVQNVLDGKYLLPSIQREFVWTTDQIEMLFDSVLRGYPISSFLFWQVPQSQVTQWQLYKFLTDYHEAKNRHNEPAKFAEKREITAVLDGQQRLTSLVIGLAGTYAYKLPNKRRSNLSAYPERKLYIDLMQPADDTDGDKRYALRFLTADEAAADTKRWWRSMPELFSKMCSLIDVLAFMAHEQVSSAPQASRDFAANTLARLCECLNTEHAIKFFLEREADLDRVLQIFIRINSGGTKLSYSDLLLSFATASWKTLDARQEIHGLVDELCSYSDELTVDKDFVLKACLVLSDVSDIKFKVTNFNSENTGKIEARWQSIRNASVLALQLVQSFGFSDRSLLSVNALIPIAYYLQKREATANFLSSSADREDRTIIRQWLIAVLLRGTFGSMADTILTAIRGVLAEEVSERFPVDAINARLAGLNRAVRFADDELETLLDIDYGDRRAFLLLSLLYPSFDYTSPFHIDHIYPRAKMSERRLTAQGLSAETARIALGQRDNLANLQLLAGGPNKAKSDTDFEEWLATKFPNATERGYFLAMHHFPPMSTFTYNNFLDFVASRRGILFKTLKAELNAEDNPLAAVTAPFSYCGLDGQALRSAPER